MSKLRQAERRVKELMEELAAVRAEKGETKMVYVLPKQKKLCTFSGNDGSSAQSFVEDARAALKVRKLKGIEAVDFILSHLDGTARREVKHQPLAMQAIADSILQAFLDTFGERRTLGSLIREIYSRLQGEDERITDFVFALMGLEDKLSNIPGAPDAEKATKEQFRDGLLDDMLRREVKRLLKAEPKTPFIKVRDWTLDMAELEF